MDDLFRKERYANTHNVYKPSVLINNWSEDLYEEEERLRKLLEEGYEGNLRIQKTCKYLKAVLQPVKLTTNLDGFLHDGDVIMLKCCFYGDSTKPLYLALKPPLLTSSEDQVFKSPCPVTATKNPACRARTAFSIYRDDSRIPNNVPIMYGEHISIFTTDAADNLKLQSEPKTVFKFAQKSKHQEVELVNEASAKIMWRIIYKNPEYRMEMEGNWIPVNTDVVVNHVFSNQSLALESEYTTRTIFGLEYEVSVHNYTDVHKVETSQNHWQFVTPPVDPDRYDTAIKLPNQNRIDPNNYHLSPPFSNEVKRLN